jgi:hypothetical protein
MTYCHNSFIRKYVLQENDLGEFRMPSLSPHLSSPVCTMGFPLVEIEKRKGIKIKQNNFSRTFRPL